jgi:uncharacterized surface protein with fasciclin (FAS1) repeats
MRTAAVWLMLGLLAPAVLAQSEPAPKSASHHKRMADLADTIDNNVILSKFAALVRASDMGTFYSSRGPFTLFAPTNSGFSKLPPGMFEDMLLPQNKAQLQRIVLFHLVNGKEWFAKDIKLQKSLVSCEGNPLPVKTTKAGTLFVHKAKVLRADEHCANGVLDEIDTLLMPPQLLLVAAVAPPDASTNAPTATNVPSADTNAVPPADVPTTAPAGPNLPAMQ